MQINSNVMQQVFLNSCDDKVDYCNKQLIDIIFNHAFWLTHLHLTFSFCDKQNDFILHRNLYKEMSRRAGVRTGATQLVGRAIVAPRSFIMMIAASFCCASMTLFVSIFGYW